METAELLALDRALVWHPFTQARTAPAPVAIRAARGALLIDAEGREILDLVSYITAAGNEHVAVRQKSRSRTTTRRRHTSNGQKYS